MRPRRCFSSNVTQSCQDVSNVAARTKTSRGIKVITNPWPDQHIHSPSSRCGRTCVAWKAVTCVGRLASTADTRVPTGHVCGLESCPNTHQQHVWSHNKYTNSHHRATEPRGREKRQCLDHSRHFSGVVGVSSGTCGTVDEPRW